MSIVRHVQVSDGQRSVKVTFEPKLDGMHKLCAKYRELHIPSSPASFFVLPNGASGAYDVLSSASNVTIKNEQQQPMLSG